MRSQIVRWQTRTRTLHGLEPGTAGVDPATGNLAGPDVQAQTRQKALQERLDDLRAAAGEAGDAGLLRFLESPPEPESLLDLSDLARGEALVEARRAVERGERCIAG